MQLHGGNTSACDCIAWFLPWVDFDIKIMCHTTHDAMIFYLFPSPLNIDPPPCPILLRLCTHMRTPSPNVTLRRGGNDEGGDSGGEQRQRRQTKTNQRRGVDDTIQPIGGGARGGGNDDNVQHDDNDEDDMIAKPMAYFEVHE